MAARPAEGPHESSRLVCEAVRGVSNTVSCAVPGPCWGLSQNKNKKQNEHPTVGVRTRRTIYAACRQDA